MKPGESAGLERILHLVEDLAQRSPSLLLRGVAPQKPKQALPHGLVRLDERQVADQRAPLSAQDSDVIAVEPQRERAQEAYLELARRWHSQAPISTSVDCHTIAMQSLRST